MLADALPTVLHRRPGALSRYGGGNHGRVSGDERDNLIYVLHHLMMRHTKAQTRNGAPLMVLPPKVEAVVTVDWRPPERAVYDEAYQNNDVSHKV